MIFVIFVISIINLYGTVWAVWLLQLVTSSLRHRQEEAMTRCETKLCKAEEGEGGGYLE